MYIYIYFTFDNDNIIINEKPLVSLHKKTISKSQTFGKIIYDLLILNCHGREVETNPAHETEIIHSKCLRIITLPKYLTSMKPCDKKLNKSRFFKKKEIKLHQNTAVWRKK